MAGHSFDDLNEAQRRAALYGMGCAEPRPLLVIAGAGTGKTGTLAHRVARLIDGGADPTRVLLLTFSRRAAAEMERRVARVLANAPGARMKNAPAELPWSGTFHSVGARILREHAERIGLASNFSIHDRGDSEDLMAWVRHELIAGKAANTRFPTAATALAIYSKATNAEQPLPDVLRDDYGWCAHLEAELRSLFAAYVAAKQRQQILDFDDLLLYWSHLMRDSGLAVAVSGKFDHVLVDEYQDTNKLQATVLRLLKPDGRGVTVVGDDAQAIYSFRAATVRNILDFPAQYQPPAAVITLERNYRSSRSILEASNALIASATERYTKNLVTERDGGGRPTLVTVRDESIQAQYVAEQVLARREEGVALMAQAVLFRSSSHSAHVELELARRDIPFVKYGGLRFLEAAHVRDALSILRWIDNPRGRLAGFRVLRLLPGIGPATASRWLDALEPATHPSALMKEIKAPATAATDWQRLTELFERLNRRESSWPAEFDALVDWYEPHLERIYDDARARHADLAQLRAIARTYATRERFLTELTLDPPSATSADAGAPHRDDDYLVLSTIHSAKGQEWKSVIVLNCIDGCIPSDMATGRTEDIEEERRLLYVAMTRAKDTLSLVVPQRCYIKQQSSSGDRHVYAGRSRFLTNAVCRCLDHLAWPMSPPASANEHGQPARPIDLASVMRNLWAG